MSAAVRDWVVKTRVMQAIYRRATGGALTWIKGRAAAALATPDRAGIARACKFSHYFAEKLGRE